MEAKINHAVANATLRDSILGDESQDEDNGRNILLTEEEAIHFGELKGGPDFQRIFFGMKASDAIKQGYQITKKGYFESPGSIPALHTAKFLKELFESLGRQEPIRLLDVFGGIGHSAWAFLRYNFSVHSYERNPFTYSCLINNLDVAGLIGNSVIQLSNGVATMNELASLGNKFDAVYLDPPWNGKYKYDHSIPFKLTDTTPPLSLLFRDALKTADIVIAKVPQNIDLQELLGESTIGKFRVLVQYQNVEGRRPEFCQASVYAFANGSGIDTQVVSLPSRLDL